MRIKLFDKFKREKKKKKYCRKKNFQFLNNNSDNTILHKKLAFAVTVSNITNYACCIIVVFTLLICDVVLITVSNRTSIQIEVFQIVNIILLCLCVL